MVPLPFTMWAGEHDGVLVVRCAGRLASPWTQEVHRTLLRQSATSMWLDISELDGIDPSGLAALVAIRQDVVSGGGRFVLRGARDSVRATFAAAGLEALEDDGHDGRDVRHGVAETAPTAGESRELEPVTKLPLKGGRDARRFPAGAPKVA
jgi:anti-anti-sigma factor